MNRTKNMQARPAEEQPVSPDPYVKALAHLEELQHRSSKAMGIFETDVLAQIQRLRERQARFAFLAIVSILLSCLVGSFLAYR